MTLTVKTAGGLDWPRVHAIVAASQFNEHQSSFDPASGMHTMSFECPDEAAADGARERIESCGRPVYSVTIEEK